MLMRVIWREKNKTSKVHFSVIFVDYKRGMRGSRGGGGGAGGPDPAHPLKNHKAILFLSNTGSDPLRRRANDGPLFVVFGILSSLFNLKNCQSWTIS